jgi:ABC-2 type transport system permease protein
MGARIRERPTGPPPAGGRRFEPLRAARIAGLYVRIGVMNEMQYRVNFFIQLFQSLLALATGLVVLALVFSHTGRLNGWSEAQLLAVLGIQILMGGLIHTFIQPNMERMMNEIRDGKLDYALTKPQDGQLMVSVRQVRLWQGVDIVSGSIVLGVAIAKVQAGVGVLDTLGFLAALALGAVMIYCFWLIIGVVAFWAVQMFEAIELFEGVFQTGRWPVGVYPIWLRLGLTFLVPIAFAITVPAEALTSRLAWQTLAGAAAFSVALFAFTRWFWLHGVRRYSGASA